MRNKEFAFYSEPPATGEDYVEKLPQTKRRFLRKSSWRAVFIIAVLVLAASLIALGTITVSYFQGQQKYGKLAQNFELTDDLSTMSVNWDALRAINPDVVAWVYVPNTNINYPLVRGKDNDYYLSHDFEGEEGWLATFGTVFMDYRDVPNWKDDAYYFYGHHMNDGSMFAAVAQMADQATFDNARIIYLLTPQGNFRLRSFSLIHCESDYALVQITFPEKEQMQAYVQEQIDNCIVNPGEIPAAQDINKVFCLATCDNYSVGRYALFAYMEQTTVPGITNEKSTTNMSKRAEISDRMAGDDGSADIIGSDNYKNLVGDESGDTQVQNGENATSSNDADGTGGTGEANSMNDSSDTSSSAGE